MKLKRQAALAVILLISLAGLGAQDAAQAKQEAASIEVRPLPISGFEETGAFKLFVRESEIGRIEYTLTKDGQYSRKFVISMAGQKSEDTLTIASNPQGEWESMKIVAPTEIVHIKRVGDAVELKLEKKGQSYSAKLDQGHILYDNYGPVFESLMLRAYDLEKKGVQKFPRFLIPSKSVTVDLEYKGKEFRSVKGREVEFQRFDLNLIGIEVGVLADAEHRIYLMDVPVQQAAFVREGYEDLMTTGPADPLLSKPGYEVRKETAMIPMRDGVRLATDLYFPVAEGLKFPVILIRTPYKKDMDEINGKYYARRGYVAAIQDCRGRFASEGRWEPFVHEPNDGYDTIEWLASRDWASGKVGMIGGSYVGWVQLWAASAKPPHLTTIIPNVAPPDPFFNIPYEYGSFFILGAIWWAEILEKEATGDLSGRVMAEINERKYERILKSLPVIDLDQKILGRRNIYWRKWIEHNTNDAYWAQANFMDKLKTLDIPVFLQSGWFDGDGIGSKLNYAALRQSQNKFIKLVLGPWGHTDQSSSKLGDFDFGKEAAPDLQTLYVRWFDYWLKGVDNKIVEEPLVQYFVMFSNTWLKGDTYPLPETKFTKFRLGSAKGANTSRGDGTLRAEVGSGGKAFDEFVYDPGDPTPWPEYYFKTEEETKREKEQTVDVEEAKKKAKAFHNSVTDARRDILVFQTEPLAEPLSVAGPVSAVLYASTSAPDTDWFVTLMDVDEKGEIFHLVRGTLRARFRNSMAKPELLEKNKIYRYDLDLWQTGITFQKGHRIRVEVASAMFPMFSRNLNTGGHNEKETKYQKATQRIYYSAEYPSHILLPVVEIKK